MYACIYQPQKNIVRTVGFVIASQMKLNENARKRSEHTVAKKITFPSDRERFPFYAILNHDNYFINVH